MKDYSYAMDLNGSRVIRLKVSQESKTVVKDQEGNEIEDSENLTDEEITKNGYTKEETPYNSDEVKTVENYRKSKEILEKRFKELVELKCKELKIEIIAVECNKDHSHMFLNCLSAKTE